MAELADALRSGRSEGSLIWVQVPASAFVRDPRYAWDFVFVPGSWRSRVASSWQVRSFNSRSIWLVVLTLATLPLVVEFNTRLTVSRQLVEEEARLKREIEIEQHRATFLQTYEQYVRSDAYVERWARVNARMVKPGEIAVVPQTPADRDRPVVSGNSVAAPRDYAGEWWAAFFAELP